MAGPAAGAVDEAEIDAPLDAREEIAGRRDAAGLGIERRQPPLPGADRGLEQWLALPAGGNSGALRGVEGAKDILARQCVDVFGRGHDSRQPLSCFKLR